MFEIPLIKPYITQSVKQKVSDVLDSCHLTEGSVTAELEEMVRTYLNVGHCIATTSCTTGLELALRCLNVRVGDEVIVPAFTYPATADAVSIVGARPVFADVDKDTMLIDYDHIESLVTPNTKVLMPVSLFGNPLDYDRLNKIKVQYDVSIIEDAACALSAEYRGIPTGTLADLTVFSLHPRKFITTGEGGLITTNDDGYAQWLRSYKRFGVQSVENKIIFERIGTNCKLSDMLAAVGVAQMQQIQHLVTKRQDQAAYYLKLLHHIEEVSLPVTTPHGKHSYQSFCIFVNNRNLILKMMRSNGIEVQIGSYYLPGQPAFKSHLGKDIKHKWNGSRRADSQCLALPLYHDMTKTDQEKVVSSLKDAINETSTRI